MYVFNYVNESDFDHVCAMVPCVLSNGWLCIPEEVFTELPSGLIDNLNTYEHKFIVLD